MLLEVGPGTTLLGLARRAAAEAPFEAVPTLRQGATSRSGGGGGGVGCGRRAWPSTGRRYQDDAGGRRIDLPTYPFQRERHWAAAGLERRPAPAVRRDAREHPLLGHRLVEANAADVSVWEGAVDLATFPYLVDHRVQGRVIVPATAYLEMVVAAGAEAFGARPLTLGRIKLHAPLALDSDTVARTQTVLAGSPGRRAWRSRSRAAGDAAGVEAGPGRCTPRAGWRSRRRRGSTLDLGGGPRAVRGRGRRRGVLPPARRSAATTGARASAVSPTCGADRTRRSPRSGRPQALADDLERYRFHPALADAAGHALAATIPLEASAGPLGGAFVGGALDRFVFYRAPRGRLFTHARRRDVGGPGNVLTGDVRLVDETGAVVAEVQGARLWYLDAGAGRRGGRHAGASTLRDPVAAGADGHRPSPPARGRWLIFADADGVGAAVAARLSGDGAGCVLVEPGERYEQLAARSVPRAARRPRRRAPTPRRPCSAAAGCAGHRSPLEPRRQGRTGRHRRPISRPLSAWAAAASCRSSRSWRRRGGRAGCRSGW